MKMFINNVAYKNLLKVLLSCRCPLSENVESDLVNYYINNSSTNNLDYSEIMEITKAEGKETVFDRLKEFILYSVDDFSRTYVISVEDVIRHFCSGFHWRRTAQLLSASYINLTDLPSWFVGHMLTPVRIVQESGSPLARYSYSGGSMLFKNIFIPSDVIVNSKKDYCIHFAFVISDITENQASIISHELDLIDNFKTYREYLSEIDYSEFQRYGNYFEICKGRYKKHFGR